MDDPHTQALEQPPSGEKNSYTDNGWRAGVFSALLLLGAIASATAAWAMSRTPDVLLTAAPLRSDLGSLPLNVKTPVEFVLKNKGREPIEILSIESSCSCTAAQMATYRIPAGSSEKLTATLSTGEKTGHTSTEIGLVFRGQGRSETFRLALRISANVQAAHDSLASVP